MKVPISTGTNSTASGMIARLMFSNTRRSPTDQPGVRDVVDQHPEQRTQGDVEREDVAEQIRVVELLRVGDRADDERHARDAGNDRKRLRNQPAAQSPSGATLSGNPAG